jgi:hypothetical protein
MNVFNKANPLLSSPAECENNSKLEFRSTINAPKKPVKNMISEAKKIHIASFPLGTPVTGS